MKTAADILRKLLASAVCIGLAWLVALHAPFRSAGAEPSRSPVTPDATPPAASPAGAPGASAAAGGGREAVLPRSSRGRLGELPLSVETFPVSSCTGALWEPAALGLCDGCTVLSRSEDGRGGVVVWMETPEGGAASEMRLGGALVRCAERGRGGTVHLYRLDPSAAGEADGFRGPGPRPLASLQMAGWTARLERAADPRSAAEAAAERFAARGWRPAVPASFGVAPSTGLALRRGSEVCIFDTDDSHLITFCGDAAATPGDAR